MKNDPNDFSKLRILLAWKRHEQPPPGFFEGFSEGIITHLRGRQGNVRVPWWERWLDWFDARPVLVGAYGVAVCGLLITGVSLRQVQEETGNAAVQEGSLFLLSAVSESPTASNRFVRMPIETSGEILSSTLPIMSYGHDGLGPRASSDWRITPVRLNYQ